MRYLGKTEYRQSFRSYMLGLLCCGTLTLLTPTVSAQTSVPNNDAAVPASEAESTPEQSPAEAEAPSTSRVSEYVRQGDRHYADADYEDAIASYTQALDLFNQNAYAYYHRGNANRQLENYEAALADYNRSLQLNPDNMFGYLYRGMALYELEEYQVAVANYSEAIKRNGANPLAYEKRGEAYHALGDKKSALSDLKEALKMYKRKEKYRKQRLVQKKIQKVHASKDKASE